MHNTMTSPSLLNSSKTAKHDDLHLWFRGDNVMIVIEEVSKDWDVLNGRQWSNLSNPEYNNGKAYRRRRLAWKPVLDEVNREVPVYSQNYKSRYLQGVCDGIILYHVEINRVVEDYKMTKKYDEDNLKAHLKTRLADYEQDLEWRKKNGFTIYDNKPTRDHVIRYDTIPYTWALVSMLEHRHEIVKQTNHENHLLNGYNDRDYIKYRILVDFKPILTSISGIIGQLKVYRDCIGPSDLMIITYDKNEKYDPILKDENIYIMRIDQDSGELYIPERQTTLSTASKPKPD